MGGWKDTLGRIFRFLQEISVTKIINQLIHVFNKY